MQKIKYIHLSDKDRKRVAEAAAEDTMDAAREFSEGLRKGELTISGRSDYRRNRKKAEKDSNNIFLVVLIIILSLILLVTGLNLSLKQKLLKDTIEYRKTLEKRQRSLQEDINALTNSLPTSPDKPISKQVEEEIRRQAGQVGIDPEFAVRMAICESSLNPVAKNPNSSARGIYQFTAGTWVDYASGSVVDYKNNIKYFMKYWPQHPEWWKSSWDCAGYSE